MDVCIGLDFIKWTLIRVEQNGLCLYFYSIAVSHVDGYFTLNTAQCISKLNRTLLGQNSHEMCFSLQSVSSPCLHLQLVQIPSSFPKNDVRCPEPRVPQHPKGHSYAF